MVLGPWVFDAYSGQRDGRAIAATLPPLDLPNDTVTIRAVSAGEELGRAITLSNTSDNIVFGVAKCYEAWFDSPALARRYVRRQDAVGVVVYAEFIPHRILSAGEQCDDGRSIP